MPLTEVFLRPLPWNLFKFPPDNDPLTLPAPQSEPGWLTPFDIPPQLYNELLSVYWPITIAVVYAGTVTILNDINRSRNNKPWAISRTGAFTAFVLAHNIFLTVYSAWTFVGMLGAMRRTFGGITDTYNDYGIAPVIDGLCKMSGPRGIGQAATFEPFYGQWTVKNQAVKLLNGNPDSTDVGRLWNEGLAFYGWLFYLSKFYEVLDTVIILAKGKRSSLLQTYHHAGAMMCMWAGIRYMSPPIWMFVQFNSGIHALMYFYYTLAALGIKVPNRIKKSLTTLQISQFIIGANYAFAHLFIAYQVPANTPYIFSHGVASAVSTAASSVASALPTAAAGWGPWLKKAVLRAVGDEGLAENVRGPSGNRFGIDALKAEISDSSRQEIRYRMEYPDVNCLDTSGQAFAIWLNVLYLLPLTYLFGRFFVTSYLKRAQAEKQQPALHQRMVRSGSDAAKGVDREIRQAMGDKQGYNSPIDDEFAVELQEEIDRVTGEIKQIAAAGKEEGKWLASRVQEKAKPVVNGAANKATEIKEEIKEESKPILDQAQSKASEVKKEVQEQAPKVAEQTQIKAQDAAIKVKEEAPQTVEAAKSKTQDVADKINKKAPKVAETAQKKTQEVGQDASKMAGIAQNKAQEVTQKLEENAPKAAETVKGKAQEVKQEAQDNAPKAAEAARSKAGEIKQEVQDNAPKAADQAEKTTKDTAAEVRDKAADVKEQVSESAKSLEPQGTAGEHADAHDAHIKSGESYADAVKQDPEPEHEHEHNDLEESAVEVSREDAENLEINPDENMSRAEVEAERVEGQQPKGQEEAEGSSESTSLFG